MWLIGHAAVWPGPATEPGSMRVCSCLVTLNHFLRYSIFKVRVAARGRASEDARPGGALQRHGDDQIRTGDPLLANQVLSQLSYIPNKWDLFT